MTDEPQRPAKPGAAGRPETRRADNPRQDRDDQPRQTRDGRPGQHPRGGKPGQRPSDGQPGQRPRGAAAALIELDHDLMKLLVRRATLVARIRGGKDHAATPAAIQAEKAVRVAWETGALAFSKDPRFIRQLFTLLQDLKVLTREQAEHSSGYTLSPAKAPVEGIIAGPSATRSAQMYALLAAALGSPLFLTGVMPSRALMDTVKAAAQAGGRVEYTASGPLGSIRVEQGTPLSFSDKTTYAGEDLFSLYLMAFLAIGRPGISRFTGGSRLKAADLAPLRHTLPLFGARLAHVIPRSQGLPATVESSGEIPPVVMVPAELPFEGVCALLLAPLAWGTTVTLNLAALPAGVATAALAEVRPLHRDANADVETHSANLAFTASALELEQNAVLPLDPTLAAYLLAMPAFAGGSLTLRGKWAPTMPEAVEAEQLLTWAGLALHAEKDSFTAVSGTDPYAMPLDINDLSPELGPLFLALAARRQLRFSQTTTFQAPLPYPADSPEETEALAQDFLSRLDLILQDGAILSRTETSEAAPEWTSPDGYWSMAYALSAFLRPGLQLANPASVSECMPIFWSIYNSLPHPADPAEIRREAPQETTGGTVTRRRIIAD